ncbi:hypothetical protein [Flavobacterium sp.]
MKTLLIVICFAIATPTFASTVQKPKLTTSEIGDNPPPPTDPTKPKG